MTSTETLALRAISDALAWNADRLAARYPDLYRWALTTRGATPITGASSAVRRDVLRCLNHERAPGAGSLPSMLAEEYLTEAAE